MNDEELTTLALGALGLGLVGAIVHQLASGAANPANAYSQAAPARDDRPAGKKRGAKKKRAKRYMDDAGCIITWEERQELLDQAARYEEVPWKHGKAGHLRSYVARLKEV